MAIRKMTFSLPEELARRFEKRVPARQRSRFIADALKAQFRQRDLELIRACEVANQDPEVQAIEREFDAIEEGISEPWDDNAAR